MGAGRATKSPVDLIFQKLLGRHKNCGVPVSICVMASNPHAGSIGIALVTARGKAWAARSLLREHLKGQHINWILHTTRLQVRRLRYLFARMDCQ